MNQIDTRAASTKDRIIKLQSILGQAGQILGDNACVYATGSFGRLEAGENSDLDLFILALDRFSGSKRFEGSRLRGLDAICVKAELITATQTLGIPEFDGDGKYLVHYCVQDLIKTLGTPEDDVSNTFTARLLLLLESQPLLGAAVYRQALDQVLTKYFRDFQDHSADFVPAFLGNDILRLWRTFCVNYEARTERNPDAKKRKGKVKNYKLKHSRLLTCYSSLIYMLAVFRIRKTFAPADAVAMVEKTPIQRLQWMAEQQDLVDAKATLDKLLAQYDDYLSTTVSEEALADKLMSRDEGKQLAQKTYEFGDSMYTAMMQVGNQTRLHRLLIV